MQVVPIVQYDQHRADNAFAVHRALLDTELRTPELKANPLWRQMRQRAFALFNDAFEQLP